MMFTEISERLRARFGDIIRPSAAGAPEAVFVQSSAIRDVAQFCKQDSELDFNAMSCLTGVDWKDRIELVYHLLSYTRRHELVLKAPLDRSRPEIPTIETGW